MRIKSHNVAVNNTLMPLVTYTICIRLSHWIIFTKLLYVSFLCTIALFYCPYSWPDNNKSISADTLKAVVLYQFANFIQWPKSAFESNQSPIRYCIANEGPLQSLLPKVIKGEKIKGRPLVYHRVNINTPLNNCHLLYIYQSNNIKIFIKRVKTLPILTISEELSFLDNGGMIVLAKQHNRIQPFVNVLQLQKNNLQASSKLLSLSIVKPKN